MIQKYEKTIVFRIKHGGENSLLGFTIRKREGS